MYHYHCSHTLLGIHISWFELEMMERPRILMVIDMARVQCKDSHIYDLCMQAEMDNLYLIYIPVMVLVDNQCMDFQQFLSDTCTQPYDFEVCIQPVVSMCYHKHMDSRTEHFHRIYRLGNRCYCGIQLYYIVHMDCLCNRSNNGIPLD